MNIELLYISWHEFLFIKLGTIFPFSDGSACILEMIYNSNQFTNLLKFFLYGKQNGQLYVFSNKRSQENGVPIQRKNLSR